MKKIIKMLTFSTTVMIIITLNSCSDSHPYMTQNQASPIGGTYYSFKGKIIGQDPLCWDIDLNGDKKADIFAVKERQNKILNEGDSVEGDDFHGYYLIRSKK